MSIDYLNMKKGLFMTEKFDFENLPAFNSAEGRILTSWLWKVATFNSAGADFLGKCAVESCHGQNSQIFAQIKNFWV
jgi:hypothetical protein